MIQNLKSVVFDVLNWVKAEVKLCQNGQVLNKPELRYFSDLVQRQVQEPKSLYLLKTSQSLNFILRKVKSVQDWQVVESCNLSHMVSGQIKLLNEQSFEVLNI